MLKVATTDRSPRLAQNLPTLFVTYRLYFQERTVDAINSFLDKGFNIFSIIFQYLGYFGSIFFVFSIFHKNTKLKYLWGLSAAISVICSFSLLFKIKCLVEITDVYIEWPVLLQIISPSLFMTFFWLILTAILISYAKGVHTE